LCSRVSDHAGVAHRSDEHPLGLVHLRTMHSLGNQASRRKFRAALAGFTRLLDRDLPKLARLIWERGLGSCP
jgi:hypothetical protein